MSDLFHEGVPLKYISKVAATMQFANWHTYQVLTKRSVRLREVDARGADLLPHERLHLCLNRKGVRVVRKTRGDRERELSHAETLACIGLQHVGRGGDQLLDKSCVAPRWRDRLVLRVGHGPSKGSDPRSCGLAFCRQLRGVVEEGIAIHGRAPFR